MNLDAKILNKTLANQIQQYVKKITNHDLWFKCDLSQGYEHFSISANQSKCNQSIRNWSNKLKNKNHMIISKDAEKVFDKIQHLFMMKTLQKVSIEGV